MQYSQEENNQKKDKNNSSTFYDLWENIKKESSISSNQELLEEIPEEEFFEDDQSRDYNFKIILAGDGAVGKTSLRQRYLGKDFSGHYQQTIGADFAVYEETVGSNKVKFIIWDLAGQPRFNEVRKMYYHGCHGALILFDITNHSSFKNLQHWINELWLNSTKGPLPFIIVANKTDLQELSIPSVSHKIIEDYVHKIGQETLKRYHFRVRSIFTSAKTGENVEIAFKRLAIQIIAHMRYLEKIRAI